MSGAAIVRALLAAHQPVADRVPNTRIIAGIVPQGAALPAIGVSTISENEVATVAREMPIKMIRERVQVTVLTKEDYAGMKALLKAAALGAGVHRGLVVGFEVRSVIVLDVGPEIPPGDDKIFEQSRDFMVTFIEAN